MRRARAGSWRPLGIRQEARGHAHVHDEVAADVRRQRMSVFLKSAPHRPPSALVEDLEGRSRGRPGALSRPRREGRRCTACVVRPRWDAALAVADVAGRRSRGWSGVRLRYSLADRDDVLLATVQGLGESVSGGFGLADARARRAERRRSACSLSSAAREVWMRRAIMSSPCFWPTTRWLIVSESFNTVSISFLTIRPTGIPVQSWTTDPTACSPTVGRMRGVSPCNVSSSPCSVFSSRRSASRSAGEVAGGAAAAASFSSLLFVPSTG